MFSRNPEKKLLKKEAKLKREQNKLIKEHDKFTGSYENAMKIWVKVMNKGKEINNIHTKLHPHANAKLRTTTRGNAAKMLSLIEKKGKNIPSIPTNIKRLITNKLGPVNNINTDINIIKNIVSKYNNNKPKHVKRRIEDYLLKSKFPAKNILSYEKLKNIMINVNSARNGVYSVKSLFTMGNTNNNMKNLYNNGAKYSIIHSQVQRAK